MERDLLFLQLRSRPQRRPLYGCSRRGLALRRRVLELRSRGLGLAGRGLGLRLRGEGLRPRWLHLGLGLRRLGDGSRLLGVGLLLLRLGLRRLGLGLRRRGVGLRHLGLGLRLRLLAAPHCAGDGLRLRWRLWRGGLALGLRRPLLDSHLADACRKRSLLLLLRRSRSP